MEQYIENLPNYMVLVRCYTFNHSAYITDALNGFTMQHTNFPYVVVMVDDASNDGEQEVIKEYIGLNFEIPIFTKDTDYAQIIYTQHKTNKNCYIAIYFLKENHYSKKKKKAPYIQPWRNKCKYEALCEGDDYWIDPLKLQKQVDFLEENFDYVMVYGQVKQYNQETNRFGKLLGKRFEDTKTLFITNPIPTLTVLYRKELINKYNLEIGSCNSWLLGDYPLWLYASIYGKVGFIASLLGVYRVLPNSASHSQDYKKKKEFVQSIFDMKLFFAELYNIASVQKVEQMKFSSLCDTAIQYNQIVDASVYYNKIINPSFNLSIKYYLNKVQARWLLKLIRKIRY